MSDGRKRILSPLTGRKKRAAWIRQEKKLHRQKQDKIQGKQVGERETKEEWLEEFLYSKGAFHHVNESDNDDESYNENKKQLQLPQGFACSCCKNSFTNSSTKPN